MRLEVRVTLWLAVLLGAAAALTLALMARFESQSLEKQSRETGQLVALATENSLEVSMLNNAPEDIRHAVRNVEEGTLIRSVSVYGRDGSVWVSSKPQPALQGARQDALLQAMAAERLTTSSGGGLLSVFVPVLKQPECGGCHASATPVLGAVGVTMDERSFQGELARSARASLFLALIPLVLAVMASVWWVRRSLLKPLAQVGDAAAQLGTGDLSVRLPAFGNDELSSVATTFNDMAARLETKAADLLGTVDRLRDDLEGMEEIHSLLASGAGLGEVLARAAGHLGSALEAAGVGIWRVGAERPEAVWGTGPPPLPTEVPLDSGITTSQGPLDEVPEERDIRWVVVPARRGDRTVAVVGVAWDPPRALSLGHRDLMVALAGLVGVAVENADLLERLKKEEQSLEGLLRKTLAAQEEERRRIARELHDETSQVLSALMMNIDLLETQAPAPEPYRARVEAVKALAEEAARNLDNMLLDLRPALLDELGLIAALRWYVAQVSDAWGIPVEFEGRTGRLPEHVEVATFRIVQEAVSNSVRHGKPSRIGVKVSATDEILRLEVEDDGVGFDMGEVSARAGTGEAVGLMGMRERAELLGGTLKVESEPGMGTRVKAEIPLSETEAAERRWQAG